MVKIWKKDESIVASYSKRCDDREIILMKATMSFVGYFMSIDASGDSDEIKLNNANAKVSQVSSLVAPLLYPFRLGNTQPLIDGINNININDLAFMDENAKAFLTNGLTNS